MRQAIPIVFIMAAALSGCANVDRNIQAQMICQKQAGPEPYSAYQLFGLAGSIAMTSTPEWQAWERQKDICVQNMIGG